MARLAEYQTPFQAELLHTDGSKLDDAKIRCPLCGNTEDIVITLMNLSGESDTRGTRLHAEMEAFAIHECKPAHVHHFVPRPTGERWEGHDVFILRCECGVTQKESTQT